MITNDFAALILTHGRPNKVKTYKTLRKSGYTGKIILVIDDEDKKINEYKEKYKNEVVVFNKEEISKEFDEADIFKDRRAIIYARNASFKIAKNLGLKYFIQLDDDYTNFNFRFSKNLNYQFTNVTNLDDVFNCCLNFMLNTPTTSIAMAQGGDFFGGSEGKFGKKIFLSRKCMNSFICLVDRPFTFNGRINEDVNTYVTEGSRGHLFFTTNQISLQQMQTQQNKGGMTELYLNSGTYVKSFYSIIFHPSSVKIQLLNSKNSRLHHKIYWENTTPKILREKLKKI